MPDDEKPKPLFHSPWVWVVGVVVALLLLPNLFQLNLTYDIQPQPTTQTDKARADYTRFVRVNKKYDAGGLSITIDRLRLLGDRIVVEVVIANPTKEKISLYPDQGSIVVGNIQMDGDMFMTEGNMSGDIQPGVTKSGVLVFKVPGEMRLDPETVSQITLHWGQIINSSYPYKNFDVTINVSQ